MHVFGGPHSGRYDDAPINPKPHELPNMKPAILGLDMRLEGPGSVLTALAVALRHRGAGTVSALGRVAFVFLGSLIVVGPRFSV